MQSKEYYRDYFASLKDVIKISYFLSIVGIAKTTFSMFMKGSNYDYYLSLNKLENLKECVINHLNNLV